LSASGGSRRRASAAIAGALLAALGARLAPGLDRDVAGAQKPPAPHSKSAGKQGLQVLWRTEIDADDLQPYLAAARDAVYVSGGRSVAILAAATGRRIGEFRNQGGDMFSSPMAVRDDLVVTADDRFVYAMDAKGAARWRYAFGASRLTNEFNPSRAPVLAPDGLILAAGPDGDLHAIASESGRGVWKTAIGLYSPFAPAIPMAVTHGLLLLDGRPSAKAPPQLIGVDIGRDRGGIRFTAELGIDVSSLVAGGSFGIVATSYAETESRRGASVIVSLDERGKKRWTIARGRHEDVRAVAGAGELLTTSQDAAGKDKGALIESWLPNGQAKGSVYVDTAVRFLAVGNDGTIYAICCGEERYVLQQVGADLKLGPRLDLGAGCPKAALLTGDGRFVVARLVSRIGAPSVAEVVAIRTPSKAAAAAGWSMPRADSHGSAQFALSSM
jgi:outer membrane protein assembly factor BamB